MNVNQRLRQFGFGLQNENRKNTASSMVLLSLQNTFTRFFAFTFLSHKYDDYRPFDAEPIY